MRKNSYYKCEMQTGSEWAAALASISTISKIVRSTFIIMSCGEGAIILWRAIYNKERGLVLT